MGADRYDETKHRLETTSPLRAVATPEKVAQAVVGLIEMADLVTGEFLMVDGGNHLSGAPVLAR